MPYSEQQQMDFLNGKLRQPAVADLQQVVATAAYGERVTPVVGAVYRDAADGRLYRITKVHMTRRIRGQLSAIFEADGPLPEERDLVISGVSLPEGNSNG